MTYRAVCLARCRVAGVAIDAEPGGAVAAKNAASVVRAGPGGGSYSVCALGASVIHCFRTLQVGEAQFRKYSSTWVTSGGSQRKPTRLSGRTTKRVGSITPNLAWADPSSSTSHRSPGMVSPVAVERNQTVASESSAATAALAASPPARSVASHRITKPGTRSRS
jgi:hypothetical protein